MFDQIPDSHRSWPWSVVGTAPDWLHRSLRPPLPGLIEARSKTCLEMELGHQQETTCMERNKRAIPDPRPSPLTPYVAYAAVTAI